MSNEILAVRRRLLGASGLGAVAALLPSHGAVAADRTAAEQANVDLVNRFCAEWGTRDLKRVTALMADDTVYRMTETTPPITGHAAIIERMQPWVDSSSKIEYEVLDTYAKGPLVINHRIDRYVSTTRPLTWEGVGVFFVQNGKIKEWSDYTIRIERS
jgi:limonene-1,2-epoxide hydrolase